uniref:Uncharacterized protein n=1 Tax=Ceratitis capitata TaxID=7213 RepID=W8CAM8_CERCA
MLTQHFPIEMPDLNEAHQKMKGKYVVILNYAPALLIHHHRKRWLVKRRKKLIACFFEFLTSVFRLRFFKHNHNSIQLKTPNDRQQLQKQHDKQQSKERNIQSK